MRVSTRLALLGAVMAPLWIAGAHAEKKTICTITVNSADEKEAFRRHLPRERFDVVELVERGRPDWLRSACRKKISCDVLVVSGHFNAGEDFYSDRIESNDHLRVDELERASCSDSCPGLFARLKEVYLFGCESLNPDPTKYSSSYGESGRERMRRLFANVPVIYGFAGAAPVGPAAASLLDRYLGSGALAEIGSGYPSSRLLSVFSRTSMVGIPGARDGDARTAYRREVCQFYDERQSAAQKLAFIHGLLGRDAAQVRLFFERIEKLFAALTDEERQAPSFTRALAEIAQDRGARERYLAIARESDRPEIRARMVKLAGTIGWLSSAEERAEHVRMVGELIARDKVSFAEVDLVCSLNRNNELDPDLRHLDFASSRPRKVSHAAALACLGSAAAHRQVLQALASSDDREVQIAQAYLRNRPLTDPGELRSVAMGIARMASTGVTVRALDTLARLNIADREILAELARAFPLAKSVGVQRAIAEVFIRSDPKAIPKPELASVLRQHRLRSPGGGEDLIDVLIRRLQSAS